MARWNGQSAAAMSAEAAMEAATQAGEVANAADVHAGEAKDMATAAQATATAAGVVAAAAVPADSRPATSGNFTPLSARPWETNTGSLTAWASKNLRVTKFHLKDPWTIAGLGVITTAAASAGTASLIFGLFALDPVTKRPASRVLWSNGASAIGPINLTQIPGLLSIAVPLVIPAGEWGVGAVWDGTSVTGPTISNHSGLSGATDSLTGANTGYQQTVLDGTVIPDPFVPVISATTGILVLAKIP